MPRYRRALTLGGTYFFTLVSFKRRKIFCDKTFRNSLRHAIQKVKNQRPFTIDAWVLLPDHMHAIWTLPHNDADYFLRWRLIKKSVTRECGGLYHQPSCVSASMKARQESTLWQRRFYEHEIRDESDYELHMNYCHYNPVKHGLITRVEDWPFSTFHRYLKQGVYSEGWAGCDVEGLECPSGPD